MNFGYVTENGVNSNCQIILHRMFMDFLQTYFYRYDIINHIQENDTGYRGSGIGDGQTNTGSRFDGGQRRLGTRMDKFESQMNRMEESQKRFEEETRNNFADIRLHLENITDRNISILAENHLNLINKMDVSATQMNRIMINEIKMNALTDQVARLQAKSS